MYDTQPNNLSDTQPKMTKKQTLPFWAVLLIMLGVVLLGSLGGYGLGIQGRVAAQSTQVGGVLSEQMTFAEQDFAAGRFDIARQRVEYVITQDPDYPGATDLLTRIILQQSITPSPTLTPTPTITPTPDLRNQEAILAEIQQKMAAQDWDGVLPILDNLRKTDPSFRTAQVDGFYYSALRNRGVAKILGTGAYAQTTNMEGGIYDLTLAERFGPLDGYAEGLRNFSRLYIIGLSFWEVNWPEAINYFSQVYSFAPNLRDSSNFTVSERYRIALLKHADTLYESTDRRTRCEALNVYFQSFSIGRDPAYEQKVNDLNLECNPPTPTIDPLLLITPTVEGGEGTPTETPTP